jgi:uncharacterized membrane protein YphA (DoxX/SURF4 family)
MIEQTMIDPVIDIIIRGAFALLFALAGLEKFHDRATFRFQLEEYQLLPRQIIPFAAAGVIFTEIVIAVLLLLPNSIYGVTMGAALLMVYGMAILVNLIRGRTWMDCGCLGSTGEGLSYWLVTRNLVLTATLLLLLLPVVPRAFVWMDYFSIFFAVFGASVAYVVLNTLLAANTRSKMWWS